MNADAFRHFFNYHFSENHNLWNNYVMSITQAQFVEDIDYSIGSVRNHIVHLINVDDAWFSGLRGVDVPDALDPVHFHEREVIREKWDEVEQRMRDYLNQLQDDDLLTKPFTDDEDKDLIVWQVLLHVVNHGADHRAQLLRMLNNFGAKTVAQGYIFYVYDNP